MTLINYLNRVHFAENILEEAIWAELDQRYDATVCVLSCPANVAGELAERLYAGLPRRIKTVEFQTNGGMPTEEEANHIAAFYQKQNCNLLLAFGRGYVVNLAKAARLLIRHNAPLSSFSESEGGTLKITRDLPDLIAIPSLQGFSAGFNGLLSILLENGSVIDISSQNLVPSVTIGDPSIAAAEPIENLASAGVGAVTLCVEALLSPIYNPPANGIALDGLSRGLQALKSISSAPDGDVLRELMAACMCAAMAQQKGLGLTHALTTSICSVVQGNLDKGIIRRILLPKTLSYYANEYPEDFGPLIKTLEVHTASDVVTAFETAFDALTLPGKLGEIGVDESHLPEITDRALHHRSLANGPARPSKTDILDVLQSTY